MKVFSIETGFKSMMRKHGIEPTNELQTDAERRDTFWYVVDLISGMGIIIVVSIISAYVL